MSNGDGGSDSEGRRVRARTESFSKMAAAIEVQRQVLAHDQVAIHSLARLMIEAYDFEIEDPDLGYCCKPSLTSYYAFRRPLSELSAS